MARAALSFIRQGRRGERQRGRERSRQRRVEGEPVLAIDRAAEVSLSKAPSGFHHSPSALKTENHKHNLASGSRSQSVVNRERSVGTYLWSEVLN